MFGSKVSNEIESSVKQHKNQRDYPVSSLHEHLNTVSIFSNKVENSTMK